MNQFFPALRHSIEQRFWKEARCLADAKLHRSAAALCHKLQEPLVFFWREACVELLAKGGNHVAPVPTGCGTGTAPALGLDQKLPMFHNLFIIHPNVEFPADHINVG